MEIKKIEIKKMELEHIKDAVELAVVEYKKESEISTQLVYNDMHVALEDMLEGLCNEGHSYVAVEAGKVIGYLAFWGPFEGFHGLAKGVFSPLGGNAFLGSDRGKLASLLISHAMQAMMEEGIITFALCRYAHDDEVAKSFVLNGFGIRCSDAIMDLSKNQKIDELKANENKNISYVELEKKEFSKVLELRKGLTLHMCHAPIFFPTDMNFFDQMESRLKNRIFAAKDQGKIVGFIELTDEEGENFISDSNMVYNICGTYVENEYRNQNIAQHILAFLVETLRKENVSFLGVDCETLNPTALRFWGKYFAPYTYSFERRIDERVMGYDQYYEQYWTKENK